MLIVQVFSKKKLEFLDLENWGFLKPGKFFKIHPNSTIKGFKRKLGIPRVLLGLFQGLICLRWYKWQEKRLHGTNFQEEINFATPFGERGEYLGNIRLMNPMVSLDLKDFFIYKSYGHLRDWSMAIDLGYDVIDKVKRVHGRR